MSLGLLHWELVERTLHILRQMVIELVAIRSDVDADRAPDQPPSGRVRDINDERSTQVEDHIPPPTAPTPAEWIVNYLPLESGAKSKADEHIGIWSRGLGQTAGRKLLPDLRFDLPLHDWIVDGRIGGIDGFAPPGKRVDGLSMPRSGALLLCVLISWERLLNSLR